ncbi:MAG: flavodoxin-dependent (E)-4-hydroxy-3-methylbut-2-enyl-diphosphate synthase, partial [Kiritimatiellae bacterium]|nr:flavodoxin-dependent (E)-4-hydroxy-3-methylbut-2-enyl-diphosphate synthase [Kiritimatiellia bacterium]
CGRTRVDVAGLAARVEERLERFYREHPDAPRPHVAVMGCVVNGPGEAKGADIAVAGGQGCFVLYVRGERIKTLPESEALETIAALVEGWGVG